MDELLTANLMRFAFKLKLISFKALDSNINELQLRLFRQHKEPHG